MLLAIAMLAHTTIAAGRVDRQRPTLPVLVRIEHENMADLANAVAVGTRNGLRPYADLTFEVSQDPRRRLAPGELQLVITDSLVGGAEGYHLGWIDFVNGKPSPTITVSVGAARALMAEATWGGLPMTSRAPGVQEMFVVRALSVAVAHEIGHYMLRSKAHSRSGLMRARFAPDDFMSAGSAAFRLNRADASRLSHQLIENARVRAGEPPPA